MNIERNLAEIKRQLPEQTSLVAVSKFQPNEAILDAYAAGQRIFGESKVQELQEKYDSLPKDIEWHFIGHLQTNKIKYIAPYVSLIHGVDSYKLLSEINKAGIKTDRKINCLLQVHIANEETKFGFSYEELDHILQEGEWRKLDHVNICGLMGMATFTSDQEQISREFETLYEYFEKTKQTYFQDQELFKELSIGMSDDYKIAIRHGSTLIRVGSAIFGNRQYN